MAQASREIVSWVFTGVSFRLPGMCPGNILIRCQKPPHLAPLEAEAVLRLPPNIQETHLSAYILFFTSTTSTPEIEEPRLQRLAQVTLVRARKNINVFHEFALGHYQF